MNSEQQKPSNEFTLTDIANLMMTIAHIWALPWELLIRWQFGSRYFDFTLFLAAIWPALFCAFFAPEFDPEWSLWAFWGMLGLAIVHRFIIIWADRRGIVRHSQYNGHPLLSSIFGWDERICKGRCEFGLTFFISFAFLAISPSMFCFMLTASIALQMKWAFILFCEGQRETDLRDSYIEQQSLAVRFRHRCY